MFLEPLVHITRLLSFHDWSGSWDRRGSGLIRTGTLSWFVGCTVVFVLVGVAAEVFEPVAVGVFGVPGFFFKVREVVDALDTVHEHFADDALSLKFGLCIIHLIYCFRDGEGNAFTRSEIVVFGVVHVRKDITDSVGGVLDSEYHVFAEEELGVDCVWSRFGLAYFDVVSQSCFHFVK